MAMIVCAGCGLPRAASEADKPCPVCEAGVHDLPEGDPCAGPESFPTDGPPADVSQLAASPAAVPFDHRPQLIAGVVGFLAGVGLLLAIQAVLPSTRNGESSSPAPIPDATVSSVLPAGPPNDSRVPAVPPRVMPKPDNSVRELAPPPREIAELVGPPAPAGDKPALVLDFNRRDEVFLFNGHMIAKGQTAVLRGKLKDLNLIGLQDVTIDASELSVQRVSIGGLLFSNVNLKLNTPQGIVIIGSTISGGSHVTIHAPEGKVRFAGPNSGINGGSQVAVTTRSLEIGGAIAGEQTRVTVTLSNGGHIKLGALRDTAALEYRKANPDDTPPWIEIPDEQIESTAVLRKVQ